MFVLRLTFQLLSLKLSPSKGKRLCLVTHRDCQWQHCMVRTCTSSGGSCSVSFHPPTHTYVPVCDLSVIININIYKVETKHYFAMFVKENSVLQKQSRLGPMAARHTPQEDMCLVRDNRRR